MSRLLKQSLNVNFVYNLDTGHVVIEEAGSPGLELSVHWKCKTCNKYLKWIEIRQLYNCPRCNGKFTK